MVLISAYAPPTTNPLLLFPGISHHVGFLELYRFLSDRNFKVQSFYCGGDSSLLPFLYSEGVPMVRNVLPNVRWALT
jgi:hypothetical protein